MKEVMTTIKPGLYQMNMGGASLRECWRLARGHRIIYALLWKITQKKSHYVWLPKNQALIECNFNQFGSRTKKNLAPEIEKASCLGFTNGQCFILKNLYTDTDAEAGTYLALHQDKKRFLSITYAYRGRLIESIDAFIETVALVYNTGFYDAGDKYRVIVHNDRFQFFDKYGQARIIYLKTQDMDKIVRRAEKEMQNCHKPKQSFQDVSHIRKFIQPLEDEVWLHRINRGLFVKVPLDNEREILQKYSS